MSSFGRKTGIATTGRKVEVLADGRTGGMKLGGITIDWSTLTALTAEETLTDGTIVAIGDKYLRYGTILDLIGTSEVQTVDLSAGDDPTAGVWTVIYGGQTTSNIAWNASAQAVQNAMEQLSNLEPGDVTVTKAGFVYTFTFAPRAGNVGPITIGSGDLTGATSVTVTQTTAGAGAGKWGPADTSASDGRQTLARGDSYILNETVVESQLGSDHPAVFDQGAGWVDRLVTAENGHTNAPTEANVLTAFPGLQLVR